MGVRTSVVRIRTLAVSLFLGSFLIMLPSYSPAAGLFEQKLFNAGAYNTAELKHLMNETHVQIDVLNNQIKTNKKDIDWLILKIDRITDSGRQPSPNLKESVNNKEKKIETLEKEKDRLTALSAFYTKEYEARKKETLSQVLKKKTETIQLESKPAAVKIEDIEEGADLSAVNRVDLESEIKKNGLADWIELSGDNTCLRINNALPILFPSGSARVAKEYQSFLQKLALLLKSYDVKVFVNGYADTDPIHTKQYPSNFELGASRAANIVHELVKNGLKPSIFQIGTTGEYRFSAKQSPKQKSFQRRAQVTVIFTS